MRNWSLRQKLFIYSTLERNVPELEQQIQMEKVRLRAIYSGSPPIITGMPSEKGTPGDPCGNAVANHVIPAQERLRDMELRLVEQTEVMRDVERFLDGLDALELAVIRLRYFCRMSWPEIAAEEYMSRATALRLHDSARAKCADTF